MPSQSKTKENQNPVFRSDLLQDRKKGTKAPEAAAPSRPKNKVSSDDKFMRRLRLMSTARAWCAKKSIPTIGWVTSAMSKFQSKHLVPKVKVIGSPSSRGRERQSAAVGGIREHSAPVLMRRRNPDDWSTIRSKLLLFPPAVAATDGRRHQHSPTKQGGTQL